MTRWQVFGAVILRKLPEVIPRRDPIHARVQQIFDSFEASKSRYSSHELQHREDIRIKESDDIRDITQGETAQDREDRWVKEKESFTFANHDDKLEKMQYLFIQSPFGTDIKDQWLLPQTTFDRKLGDTSLVDTARRALNDLFKIYNGYQIVSKVPSSVLSTRYPRKIREMTGFVGAKVFFLKAHLDLPDGAVMDALDASKNDRLRWLTRNEAEKLVQKDYMHSFASGLLTEESVDVEQVLKRASNYVSTSKRLSADVSQ